MKENCFEVLKAYERMHLLTTSGVMEKIQTISTFQLKTKSIFFFLVSLQSFLRFLLKLRNQVMFV